jgi:hypothetical protein
MSKSGFQFFRGAVLAVLLAVGGAAQAEIHALVLTIGDYQGGVPPLKGVRHDGESAVAMARRLGVKDSNLLRFRDGELTLTGLRKAFDQLTNRVQPDDQVFIYYSGHGGRQYVESEKRCAESLVTVDANHLLDTELQTRLKILSAKAEKVVVFLDACHSGGVTTRALGKAEPKFTPKYWAKGGLDSCQAPINRLTRGLNVEAKSAGQGAQNYIYIAAARDNEVSLDQPGKGGVATQSWLACMNGEARDLDGSGAISTEEIRQCAQARIDQTLKDVEGYLPHHVTVTGNANAVLAFGRPTGSKTADAVASTTATTAAPAESAVISPQHTLADVYHRRDDRRRVMLATSKPAFQINRDKVEFDLSSSHAGYVYLLMVGSDGKTFDMLFPNQLDKNNYIEAGQTLRLPRSDWELVAQGPAGKNHLLAIVADAPRDFAGLGMQPAGPFSVLGANPVSAKDIVLVSGSSANAASQECANGPTKRSLAVQKKCSNAYGAALATVEEVD